MILLASMAHFLKADSWDSLKIGDTMVVLLGSRYLGDLSVVAQYSGVLYRLSLASGQKSDLWWHQVDKNVAKIVRRTCVVHITRGMKQDV